MPESPQTPSFADHAEAVWPGRALSTLAAVGVAFIVALIAVPWTLAQWWLTYDAVEHLAIAHAWVHGEGFVNPVQWTYFKSTGVPFPAPATRAPVISVLVALPLAFGASLSAVMQLHALWSSAIAGVFVVVAQRCGMRLPAALGAALLMGTAPAWLVLTRFVWTEATALLSFLLVIATARGVVRSVPGAILCAAMTVLAWLCRPNLGLLAVAVLVAGVWQIRWRGALKSAPLLAYLLGFVTMGGCAYTALYSAMGEAPYSRYDALFQVLTTSDAWYYAKEYPGAWAFSWNHRDEILARAVATAVEFSQVLFRAAFYHWLGWLAVPAFAYAFWRGGERALELRSAALAGFGLALIAVLYIDFDRVRFPLFTAAAASLCGMAMIDDLVRGIERRARGLRSSERLNFAFVPLILVPLPFVLGTLGDSVTQSLRMWRAYQANGTVEKMSRDGDQAIRSLCRYVDADAIVAGPDPWHYQLWCGNAAMMLPRDLDDEERLARYLDTEHPGYVIAPQRYSVLGASKRLRRIVQSAGLVVYEVRGAAADSRPWNAPPPLACAGKPPPCGRLSVLKTSPSPLSATELQ